MPKNPSLVEVTLIKAQTYIYKALKFEFDIPQVVSADVAEHLANNATRSVKISSGGKVDREEIQLFRFVDLVEAEDTEDDDDLPDEPMAAAPITATPITPAATAAPAEPEGTAASTRKRTTRGAAPKAGKTKPDADA
jgi:hypothetical protein